MKTLNIVTWNILYDKGGFFNAEPQASRQKSIIQTLTSLGLSLDVVGLLEVEDNKQSGHHGKKIAQHTVGNEGNWTTNKAAGEDLGLFGIRVQDMTVYDIAGGRTMVVAQIGDIAIGLVHFTFDMKSDRLRSQQSQQAVAILADYDQAVLMGDFNSASWQPSRRIIERADFRSVFQVLGRRRPPTILTEKYRQQLSMQYKLATKYGFSPDDIYIKGLEVASADVFEGESDHRGVWAQLKIG